MHLTPIGIDKKPLPFYKGNGFLLIHNITSKLPSLWEIEEPIGVFQIIWLCSALVGTGTRLVGDLPRDPKTSLHRGEKIVPQSSQQTTHYKLENPSRHPNVREPRPIPLENPATAAASPNITDRRYTRSRTRHRHSHRPTPSQEHHPQARAAL